MEQLATLWPAIGPLVPLLALLAANWAKPVRRLLFRSLYARILQDIADDLAGERERHRTALDVLTTECQALGRDLARTERERDQAQGELVILREQNQLLRDAVAQREREIEALKDEGQRRELAFLHAQAQRETEIGLLRELLRRHAPGVALPAEQTT